MQLNSVPHQSSIVNNIENAMTKKALLTIKIMATKIIGIEKEYQQSRFII